MAKATSSPAHTSSALTSEKSHTAENEQLTPEQQIAIAEAAVKGGSAQEAGEQSIPDWVASHASDKPKS